LDVGVFGNVRHDGIRMEPKSGLEFGHRVEVEMPIATKAGRDPGVAADTPCSTATPLHTFPNFS
jgi:hypothetical protein